jgi:UDPglucose--hexose-1-phosphate uridylyltransferase
VAELRKDPTTRRWAIIATERWKRPNELAKKKGGKKKKFCPFDKGSEELATATVYPHFKQPGKWKVWVTPNKFPALSSEGVPRTTIQGMFTTIDAVGGHEVFVDSAKHTATLANMKPIEIETILNAYRERYKYWLKDDRVKYVLIFKNYGPDAGASLVHPHSQLTATPVVPPRVVEEMEKGERYYKDRKHCIICDLIRDEIALDKRVAYMNDRFIVICPFASRFPFETMILPREHSSNFMDISDSDIESLADIMSRLFRRMKDLLDDPSFNYLVHISPQYAPNLRFYHWHIEIIPRLTEVAGFEWGAGIYINPTPPEEAARELKGE